MNPYESPQHANSPRQRWTMPAVRLAACLAGATVFSALLTYIAFLWAIGWAFYDGPQEWPSNRFWHSLSGGVLTVLYWLTVTLGLAALAPASVWVLARLRRAR